MSDGDGTTILADEFLLWVDLHHPPLTFSIQTLNQHPKEGGVKGYCFSRGFSSMNINTMIIFSVNVLYSNVIYK